MLALLSAVAEGYETDQLTWRDRQLADATPIANRAMNALLALAVERTNARTACAGNDAEVRAVLADEIHLATSHPTRVSERGILRSPGFSTFSAALESDPEVDRFGFADREDIYGAVGPWQSVILSTAGPCSTFEIAGVRMGSDKLDHFLDTGFAYWRMAERSEPESVIARGTRTERSIYGLLTSKTFSYADLRANWDGWRFYRTLLAPGSGFRRGEDGCVSVARPFDWREWADWEWDEVLNPPVYTHLVEAAVLRGLDERRGEVCAARSRWDPGEWRELAVQSLPPPAYVVGPAPARRDPWQLDALCDPARTAPLQSSAIRPRDEVRDQRRVEVSIPSEGGPTVR